MQKRLINANDLERRSVVREDGHRYVPWLAIAEVPTASLDPDLSYQFCGMCGRPLTENGWRMFTRRVEEYVLGGGVEADHDA